MEITYRDFVEGDRYEVGKLAEQMIEYWEVIDDFKLLSKGEGYVEKWWQITDKRLKDHEYKFVVAETNQKVVGFCLGVVEKEEEVSTMDFLDIKKIKVGDIVDICTDKEYRGLGVGSKLMDMVEAYLKKQGCDYLWLQVMETNEKARQIYLKRGYKNRLVSMMKKID